MLPVQYARSEKVISHNTADLAIHERDTLYSSSTTFRKSTRAWVFRTVQVSIIMPWFCPYKYMSVVISYRTWVRYHARVPPQPVSVQNRENFIHSMWALPYRHSVKVRKVQERWNFVQYMCALSYKCSITGRKVHKNVRSLYKYTWTLSHKYFRNWESSVRFDIGKSLSCKRDILASTECAIK